ncbi:hypothetical protein GCM10010234_41010 [Streptomyces hawaiiensis]|uniref:hypothetical protein n=1 Tax=Streptomyces hawaiiensis TaxID=67305 RepID=UPI0031CF05A7
MSSSSVLSLGSVLAGPAEQAAVTTLVTEPEAPVSGAPVYAPEANGLLLNLLLLSPKEPKEPKEPEGE